MSRFLFTLALVLCAGFGAAWAQEGSRARSSQPGGSLAEARALSRVARPGAPGPARGRSAARQTPRPTPGQPAEQRPRLQLDPDAPPHKRLVFRLENAPASDVANTLSKLLDELRDVGQLPNAIILLPEPVTNSLVISAAPEDLEQIAELVGQLDQRPQSVRVELLIAEVQQKGKPRTLARKRSSGNAGRKTRWGRGKQPARPSAAVKLPAEAGGPERSKSNQGVRRQLRALQGGGQLKILNRTQITTLDNQPAHIHIGQKIPVFRTAGTKEGARTTVAYEDVGLKVGIWPRISPNGRVTMEINVEKSELGPPSEGVPAGVLPSGKVVRLPRIETTTLQTTVNVADGESTVIGGLTVESGPHRSKLIILVTPHIVKE